MAKYRRRKPRGFGLLSGLAILMVAGLFLQDKQDILPEGLRPSGELSLDAGGSAVDGLIEMIKIPAMLLTVAAALYAAYKLWRRRAWVRKMRYSRIYEIDRMTGKQFEQYLEVYFRDLGYKVDPVGGSGDKGADLILTASDGRRILVQAKRYGKMEQGKFVGGHVPYEAVQQAHTAKDLYRCQEAWVVTNNKGFTKQARETADQLNIQLWNRMELIQRMASYNEGRQKEQRAATQAVTEGVFYALPTSSVFHGLNCKNGQQVAQKAGAVRYESYAEATAAGKRKCNCFE